MPKSFLSNFMIAALVMSTCYSLYYYPFETYYFYYVDSLLFLSLLLLFPLYYIYIRLLTVDSFFSLKKHGKFFIIPVCLFVLLTIAVFSISQVEHYDILYKKNAIAKTTDMHFYLIIFNIARVYYLVQSIVFAILSFLQILRYKKSIENYYANYDAKLFNKVYILTLIISAASLIFVVITFMGKYTFFETEIFFLINSLFFSGLFFTIGFLGDRQISTVICDEINLADFAEEPENDEYNQLEDIKNRINNLFEKEKIYLTKNLNLWDVSNLLGVNRARFSLMINNVYNKNFATFVNSYRIKHAKNLLATNPDFTNTDLANLSGFGSVVSMQRAFQNIEGKTITQIRNGK
ncbi:helix-turn-helix domain-containing protein [Bacteroidales bacterium OttesenSCG-928-I21]|nr:helix-turn-helix domain-containing protein [Bacteroidales bacterium OttesenSCG-928-I21]